MPVALREESVDRNSWAPVNDGPDLCRSPRGERVLNTNKRNLFKDPTCVALREESVDRNIQDNTVFKGKQQSLSARRAWIEIDSRKEIYRRLEVALREESVDRNVESIEPLQNMPKSLSARRAWIEISSTFSSLGVLLSSLSARRAWIEIPMSVHPSG